MQAVDRSSASASSKLVVSFLAMVVIGLGNKIFQKLQTIPMHNYPLFLSIFSTFIYIPTSFAYIIPMIKYGSSITYEQRSIPKHLFAVMGALDSVAGILQTFAATYLGGSLLILLSQAAIPVSMVISKLLLRTRYSKFEYTGAIVVAFGLFVVLARTNFDSAGGTSAHMIVVWSLVMIFSCVPMCLSSVYKERVLGEADLDPVYLNGWVALFQFMAAIPLMVPGGMVETPPIEPRNLTKNLYDGFKCYLGQNTILDGPHRDNCEKATIYVTAYWLFNIIYNLLIILILKFGSANILWLAMTIMVPLGNVAFTLPFMPEHQPLHANDIAGLVLIMAGLFIYRFMGSCFSKKSIKHAAHSRSPDDLKKALIDRETDEHHV